MHPQGACFLRASSPLHTRHWHVGINEGHLPPLVIRTVLLRCYGQQASWKGSPSDREAEVLRCPQFTAAFPTCHYPSAVARDLTRSGANTASLPSPPLPTAGSHGRSSVHPQATLVAQEGRPPNVRAGSIPCTPAPGGRRGRREQRRERPWLYLTHSNLLRAPPLCQARAVPGTQEERLTSCPGGLEGKTGIN